jgi:hypothetical protein
MRTFKALLGIGTVVCVALCLLALPTSGVAATPRLYLKTQDGAVLPTGAKIKVSTGLNIGCVSVEEGTLTANRKSTDKIVLENVVHRVCDVPPGVPAGPTGSIGSLLLSWTGHARFKKPKLALEQEGPCSYEIFGLNGSFAIPGFFLSEGLASGWLQRKASNVECAQLEPVAFETKLFYENIAPAGLIETELRG